MRPPTNGAKHEIPTKRVLIAGATGYLGGFVAQELNARGHFVRALARSPEKLEGIRAKEKLDIELTEAEDAKLLKVNEKKQSIYKKAMIILGR